MKIRNAFLTTAALACLARPALAEYDEPAEVNPDPAMEQTVDDQADDSSGNEDNAGLEMVKPDAGDMVAPDDGADALPQPESQKRNAISFRVSVTPTYDDNIFIQEKNAESDLIVSLAAGFTLGVGDLKEKKEGFVAVSYDANAFFFTDHSDLNSVDHDAAVAGQWAGAKLTIDTTLEFKDLTGTNNETADRINRKSYAGAVNLTYRWSDKTTLGSELGIFINDYEKQLDTQEANLRMWADYEASVLTKFGAGVTVGQIDVTSGSKQTYVQLLARINYALDAKVALRADAGCELRKVESGSSSTTPVFNVSASYSPYDLLKWQLSGYRRVSPSIVDSGANTIVTGVSVSATYRFMQKFELNLTGAYERTSYEGTGEGESVSREDDYFLVRAGLNYALIENMQIGVFYQYRTNSSSQEDRSFDNQQVGMQLGYAF